MTRRRVLTFDRAIQRFLAHLADEKGSTPRTLDSYERILGYAVNTWGDDTDPLSVDEDDVLDALASWRRTSASTKANRISCLRTFFDWLGRRYADDAWKNPMADINRPRKRKTARRRLQPDDVARILGSAMTERDRLVVWLFAMTGIRKTELRDLRWRDADVEHRLLRVHGKGEKGREIPLPLPLARLLADTRAKLQEHSQADPDHYLVCRRYEYQEGRSGKRRQRLYADQPIGNSTAAKILVRVARNAGIPDPGHVGPHDLRRAYALVFLQANPGDIYRLQALLGHEDVSTTRVYLPDADFSHQREAVDRVAFGEELVTGHEHLRTAPRETPANHGEEADEGTRTLGPPTPPSQPDGHEPDTGFVADEEGS